MGKTKTDIKGERCGFLEILFYIGGDKKTSDSCCHRIKKSQLPCKKFYPNYPLRGSVHGPPWGEGRLGPTPGGVPRRYTSKLIEKMPDLRSGNLGNSGIVLRKQFKVKGMLYAKKNIDCGIICESDKSKIIRKWPNSAPR